MARRLPTGRRTAGWHLLRRGGGGRIPSRATARECRQTDRGDAAVVRRALPEQHLVSGTAREGMHIPTASCRRLDRKLMPHLLTLIREDVANVMERIPPPSLALEVCLCYPGLHAVWFYRVNHWLWNHGLCPDCPLAFAVRSLSNRHRDSSRGEDRTQAVHRSRHGSRDRRNHNRGR